MRLQQTLLHLLALITAIHALALPTAFTDLLSDTKELYKRRGGGGGRGGSGGSRSGSSGSRGSSGGGSSTPRGSGLGGRPLNSPQSNIGGRSIGGSGPGRSFAGNRYGGGAAVPYQAGRTPGGFRGPTPILLGVGGLALFPGLWYYGAYRYRREEGDEEVTYFNETSGQNETRPYECLCGEYETCGCDNVDDQEWLDEVANNETLALVRNDTLYINGTLPNGTTAPGGDEPAAGTQENGAGGRQQKVLEALGWWPLVAGGAYVAMAM